MAVLCAAAGSVTASDAMVDDSARLDEERRVIRRVPNIPEPAKSALPGEWVLRLGGFQTFAFLLICTVGLALFGWWISAWSQRGIDVRIAFGALLIGGVLVGYPRTAKMRARLGTRPPPRRRSEMARRGALPAAGAGGAGLAYLLHPGGGVALGIAIVSFALCGFLFGAAVSNALHWDAVIAGRRRQAAQRLDPAPVDGD
jgi:hypothetical protein